MKVGDLVYKADKWVQYNSWMEDTELDHSDKTKLGIVVKIGEKRGQSIAQVAWFHKGDSTHSLGQLVRFNPDK